MCYKLQDTSYRLQDTSYRLHDTSYRLHDTSYKSQGAGYWVKGPGYTLLLILFMNTVFLQAQKEYSNSNGRIIMVNRMDVTRTKTIRTDKPLTIRTINGQKFKGICYVEDHMTIICGKERISPDSIYALNGLVARNSKEKVLGVSLGILSAGAAIYPLYLIIGGFGLGDGNSLFVGITLLSFDLLIMYAAASLIGIYPRRFNIMNWGIRMESPVQELLYIPNEVRGYN